MDWQRARNIAGVVALVTIPGNLYSFYVQWTTRHAGESLTPAFWTVVGLMSAGAFIALAVLALVFHIAGLRANDPQSVTIHSAKYGTHPVNDLDVTAALRKNKTEILNLDVTNDRLNCPGYDRDPVPEHRKRLIVEYSIGRSKARQTVEVRERDHLSISAAGATVTPEQPRSVFMR